MALLGVLPLPRQTQEVYEDEPMEEDPQAPMAGPPAYLCRKNFVPRSMGDFGDGGAFPEIHVSQ